MSKSQGRYFEVHLPWLLLLHGEEASCEQSRLDVCKSAVLPLHHASSGKDQRRWAGFQCFFRFIVLRSFRNKFPFLRHLTNLRTVKSTLSWLLHGITRIISLYIYAFYILFTFSRLDKLPRKRGPPKKTELASLEKKNTHTQTTYPKPTWK